MSVTSKLTTRNEEEGGWRTDRRVRTKVEAGDGGIFYGKYTHMMGGLYQ